MRVLCIAVRCAVEAVSRGLRLRRCAMKGDYRVEVKKEEEEE